MNDQPTMNGMFYGEHMRNPKLNDVFKGCIFDGKAWQLIKTGVVTIIR